MPQLNYFQKQNNNLCIFWYLFSHCIVSAPFAIPWTIVLQAPLFTGCPRQEYWNELPFPSPGDHPNPGIEPASPALAGRFFTTELPGKTIMTYTSVQIHRKVLCNVCSLIKIKTKMIKIIWSQFSIFFSDIHSKAWQCLWNFPVKIIKEWITVTAKTNKMILLLIKQ